MPLGRREQTDRLKARRLLHGLIRRHFSTAELRHLCFDIGVEFDSLSSSGGRDDYITALLLYSFRTSATERLLQRLRELRPEADWPTIKQLES
jgi:hypothetical protein